MGEVFVVDSQATANLVPPKHWIKGTYILHMLLGLALCGVFVEGVLIYQLFQRIPTQTSPETPQTSKQTGGNKTQDDAYFTETSTPLPPNKCDSKPAAFLHLRNHSVSSDMTVMHWDNHGFPAFMCSFNYSTGSLIILKEGLYYLFSKITFRSNCSSFKHEIKLNSTRYNHHPITLMMDNRYGSVDQIKHADKRSWFSSYLGGVMKLFKKDMVFVSISNCMLEETQETFFGGFMI